MQYKLTCDPAIKHGDKLEPIIVTVNKVDCAATALELAAAVLRKTAKGVHIEKLTLELTSLEDFKPPMDEQGY
jgi:hypothetical protein